jgi:multicomponent Na+:H+ antiporter subunit D
VGQEFTLRTSAARHDMEQRAWARARRLVDNLYAHHGPHGILARSWPTGSMVVWVAVLLGLSAIVYHL